MKNICENLDQGTEPNRIVVDIKYSASATIVIEEAVAWQNAQTRAKVVLKTSDTTKRSALTNLNGEFPSAATSTRIKNQNQ